MMHSDIPEKVRLLISDHVNALGLDVFIGEFPKAAEECVSIWLDENAGSSTFFGQAAEIVRPIIRFMVRSTSYPKANDVSKAIKITLNKFHDAELLGFSLIGTIQYLGRDPDGRHEFRQSYKSIIKE